MVASIEILVIENEMLSWHAEPPSRNTNGWLMRSIPTRVPPSTVALIVSPVTAVWRVTTEPLCLPVKESIVRN
jgi:hypothetical protein